MNIFRKIRASLRLREAVRQADEKHKETGERYYVMPAGGKKGQLTEILSIHNDKLTFFPTGRHNVVTFSSFFVFFVCLSDCFT